MSWNAWRVVGTALQMGGLALAAYGVAETRESYAPERRGVVGTIHASLVRRGAVVRQFVRTKVLRRPSAARVMSGSVTGTIAMTGTAYGHLAYGALDPSTTVEDRVAVLDDRTRATRDEINRLDTETRELRQRLDGLAVSLEAAKSELRDVLQSDVRRLATDGLSREAIGLAATALGTLIAAFG